MEEIYEFKVGREFYMFLIDSAIIQTMYAYEMQFGPNTYDNGFDIGYCVGKRDLILAQANMHANVYNVLARF